MKNSIRVITQADVARYQQLRETDRKLMARIMEMNRRAAMPSGRLSSCCVGNGGGAVDEHDSAGLRDGLAVRAQPAALHQAVAQLTANSRQLTARQARRFSCSLFPKTCSLSFGRPHTPLVVVSAEFPDVGIDLVHDVIFVDAHGDLAQLTADS